MGNFRIVIYHIKPHNISGAPENCPTYFQLAVNFTCNIEILHVGSLNASNYSKKMENTFHRYN